MFSSWRRRVLWLLVFVTFTLIKILNFIYYFPHRNLLHLLYIFCPILYYLKFVATLLLLLASSFCFFYLFATLWLLVATAPLLQVNVLLLLTSTTQFWFFGQFQLLELCSLVYHHPASTSYETTFTDQNKSEAPSQSGGLNGSVLKGHVTITTWDQHERTVGATSWMCPLKPGFLYLLQVDLQLSTSCNWWIGERLRDLTGTGRTPTWHRHSMDL